MVQTINRRPRITNGMVVWLLAVATLAALVLAQVEPAEPMPVVLGPATDAAPVSGAAETGDSNDQMGAAIQSLSFKEGTPIRTALKMLAIKYQQNIVPSPRIDGQIMVTELFQVSFAEALQAVIGPDNKYEAEGRFIRIYTRDEYEQIKADKRRMEDRTFTLHYLSAKEAEKLIEPLRSDDGKIAISTPAQTDVPADASISGDKAGGDNLAFEDTVVIKDYPENVAAIEALITQLDVRPKQVLVEATILSATLTEEMKFGVDWNLAAGVSLTGTAATQDLVSGDTVSRGTAATSPIGQIGSGSVAAGTPIEIAGFANTANGGLRIGVTAADMSILITALETITDTTILANPKVLAVNKQLGQVYIGRKIGYREGDRISEGGRVEEGNVTFLETGTKLAFRPYIGNDGYIRMQIHPKDSIGVSKGDQPPDEISSELATNVIVRDGQTIILGGLFRDSVESQKSQVPILGNLPFIGDAFKGIGDFNRREEVIVLLTPHIIDTPDTLAENEKNADPLKMRRRAGKALNWMSTARQADDCYEKAAGLYGDGDACRALQELNWALHLRPTFIEAARLRERIVRETVADSGHNIDTIMADVIKREQVIWFK